MSESAGEEEQGGCDDSDDRSDAEPEGDASWRALVVVPRR